MEKIRDFFKWHWIGVIGWTIGIGLFLLAWRASYLSCEKQAEVINAKYGTEYTAADIWRAGCTIKSVIVGTKHNIDIEEK